MNSKSTKPRLGGSFYSALAYLGTTFVCLWLLKNTLVDASTPVRAVVSLLPLIPIGFAIRSVLHLIRNGDELEQRIDLEALAVSAVAVGMVALTLNLLIKANVIEISPHVATIWVFPGLLLIYIAAKIWARSRYQ